MYRVYINDKDEAEWYLQKWQKKCELYDMIRVLTKKITIFDWINVEKIDIYDIQKEKFSEYNEEVYVSKNYEFNEEVIKQEKTWKKTENRLRSLQQRLLMLSENHRNQNHQHSYITLDKH